MQTMRLLRRQIRILIRMFKDWNSHTVFCRKRTVPSFSYGLRVEQPLLPSSTFAEKKYNLEYAADRIRDYVILPGEVFSFWKAVGSPDKLRGSRCIRNGKVNIEKGGGLCQVASVLFHLALMGGLKVVERYNHSVDLYGDGPRACPLGLDATVCYGYKDLRILNTTDSILHFLLQTNEDSIQAVLQSSRPLKQREIRMDEKRMDDVVVVQLKYADSNELIVESIYRRYKEK